MIKRLLVIAVVASAGLVAAPKAEAGPPRHHSSHTYCSGHASCGCPMYTKRYVRGRDCYGRPIFGYTRVAFSHRSGCRHHPSYGQRHRDHRGHGHHYRRSHGPQISISGGGVRFSIGGHSRHYSRGRSCR